MSQVQAISGATSTELVKLTNKAKEMGATTKFTAEESAQAFNYMAMAGWKTDDMLNRYRRHSQLGRSFRRRFGNDIRYCYGCTYGVQYESQ